MSERASIAAAHRVVVKVGSSSLTTLPGGLDVDRLRALVDVLGALRAAGRQVVLVSSGAIAAGLGGRGTDTRLENNARLSADDRLAAKKARRLPYEMAEDGWIDADLIDDAREK